jgi:HPt (histidine-containing phosphotransfer) domain-containing protein
LSDGNQDVYNELLARFLKNIPQYVLEIKEHAKENDLENLRHKAHSLKSPVSFLKITAGVAILIELEKGLLEDDRINLLARIVQLDTLLGGIVEELKAKQL